MAKEGLTGGFGVMEGRYHGPARARFTNGFTLVNDLSSQ